MARTIPDRGQGQQNGRGQQQPRARAPDYRPCVGCAFLDAPRRQCRHPTCALPTTNWLSGYVEVAYASLDFARSPTGPCLPTAILYEPVPTRSSLPPDVGSR
jgi:hypothetical protein